MYISFLNPKEVAVYVHTQRISNLYQKWQLFKNVSNMRSNVSHADMVLYNICGRIFDPRLIDTDSRRMEQICNSYIVQICTDHIYDSEVLCIFVPKRRENVFS